MYNLKLKSIIVGKFRNQGNFSQAIGVREAIISRVLNKRHCLSVTEQERWADMLGVKVIEIFDEPVKIVA